MTILIKIQECLNAALIRWVPTADSTGCQSLYFYERPLNFLVWYPVFPLVPDDEEEISTKTLKCKLYIKVGNRHQVYVWWQDMSSNLQINAEFEMEKKREKSRQRGSFEVHSNVTAEGLHHQKSKENIDGYCFISAHKTGCAVRQL